MAPARESPTPVDSPCIDSDDCLPRQCRLFLNAALFGAIKRFPDGAESVYDRAPDDAMMLFSLLTAASWPQPG